MASIISAGTTTSTALNMSADTSGVLQLASNNGTVALTVDTSQNLLVGLTSALINQGVTTNINTSSGISFQRATNTSYPSQITGKFNGGDNFGFINPSGATGATYYMDNASQHIWTASTGTSSERMRIDSSGNLLIGTTTTTGKLCADIGSSTFTNGTANAFLNWRAATGRPCIQVQSIQSGQDVAFRAAAYDGTTSYYWTFGQNISSATGNLDFMYYSVAGTQTTSSGTTQIRFTNSGQVYNTSGTYGTISDAKLKENIVDATPKLDSLMGLKVRNFTLKADETKAKQLGFIAQEVQQVFPACVESFDDIDPDTKEKIGETLTVKTAILIPMLVKAIQELNAKVTALENK
jgi:hypothetical protein